MARKQRGMILLISLLFLMMLTAVAVNVVHQSSRSPRMIANAEIKSVTFHQAQGELNQMVALGMGSFEPNQCNGLRGPYNPFPVDDPDGTMSDGDKLAHACGTNAEAPNPSIRYQASSQVMPRSEKASGVGKYQVEFYRAETTQTQVGIDTSLALNVFKVMLADPSSSGGGGKTHEMAATIGSAAAAEP